MHAPLDPVDPQVKEVPPPGGHPAFPVVKPPRYFVDTAQGRVGPLTQPQLKELIDAGTLNSSSYLMREEATEWKEAKALFPGLFPQEAAPPIASSMPVPPSQLVYGGFWIRAAGNFLDALMINLVLLVFGIIFGGISALTEGLSAVIFGPVYLIMMIAACLYKPLMQLSPWHATLGMRFCSLKIRTEGGAWPDGGKIVIRALGSLVSALAFGLGYLWMIGDEKKRTWHDRMAGTVVVIEK